MNPEDAQYRTATVCVMSRRPRMAEPSREQGALDDDEHGRRTALEIGDRARSQSVAVIAGLPMADLDTAGK